MNPRLKLRFLSDMSGYKIWADSLWDNGYCYSVKEAAKDLHVTERWIRIYVLEDVSYIIYDSKYMFERFGKGRMCKTFIRKEDLENWIQKKGRYEAQTEMVDLYSYLSIANKKKADEILKEYRECFDKNPGFYKIGTIPDKVFKSIRKEFNLHSDINKNANQIERSKYP